MDELNHLGWVVYKSFEFAGHLLGIRTNSEDVGDWLSHALGAYEVHDTEAEPVYSIWIPEVDDDSVGQRYLVLYREASDLLRTFDTARLAQRLIWELETFALRRRDDAVYLNAGIAGTEGATALIPSDIVPFIRLAGRRAERELNLPVAPTIAVDFDGSLRAVGDQLDVPADAATSLAELLGLEGAAEARELTVPQSVDFVCAFHYAPELPSIAPLTRAGAVHWFAQYVINIERIGGRSLEPLGRLVENAYCYALQEANAKESATLLKTVLAGDVGLLDAATA